MGNSLLSIASVIGVSLVSFVGLITLSLGKERLQRLSNTFISFAAGSLLGDAFIHLVPSSSQTKSPLRQPSLLILAGMMAFFVVEKLMRHRHGATPVSHVGGCLEKPELVAI